MPYQTIYVNAEIAAQANNITVYKTYKNNDIENPYNRWYSTEINQCDYDGESDAWIDIESLSTYKKDTNHSDILKAAIEKGEIIQTKRS